MRSRVTGVLGEDTELLTVHYFQLCNLSPANEAQGVSDGFSVFVIGFGNRAWAAALWLWATELLGSQFGWRGAFAIWMP